MPIAQHVLDDGQFIGLNTNNQASGLAQKKWHAALTLEFSQKSARSFLAKKQHVGPLLVQKTLHPEGEAVCHAVIIHPPGGVAGGDALTLNVQVNADAHALLTTPGAGKWYKANNLDASQQLNFSVADGASLEWLPQENILFDGAQVQLSANVELAEQAKFAGWEILCFGRQAQGELWQTGSLQQQFAIRRNQALIWQERAYLRPNLPVMQSLAGLNGCAVSASFVVAAGAVPLDILAACRQIKPLSGDMDRYAVTALPEIFSARYVGQSAACARHYFEQLWHIVRPWYARRCVMRPRIWNT